MGYRTIVVGTDGSITAVAAQRTAARLARRLRAELVIVSAYDPPRISRPMGEGLIQRAREAARREKVEATTELGRGEPADLILEVANRRQADLVVVGNKGMGQATRIRLGSVPDRVAHAAECDILIVDTTRDPKPDGGTYRRIVAATDGSATASEAARKAFELAMLVRAGVTLVYVGDPIVGAITLEETTSTRPEGVKVDPILAEGDPAEKIVQAAQAVEADLIVVGNKGMAGARRVFLGSVPNRVAHDATTDVLIAKTVDRSLDDLVPGHGGLVDVRGQKLAVYVDEDGHYHALSPKCTHMGCNVDWNDAEKTWDCPCHGSRYDVEGEVIRGPAVKSLARQEIAGS